MRSSWAPPGPPPGGSGIEPPRGPTVAQANLFFLFALLLGVATSGLNRAGLPGVLATQALIFGVLPAALAAGSRLPLRHAFRLRPVGVQTLAASLLAGLLAWAMAQAVSVMTVVFLSRAGGEPYNPYAPLLREGGSAWLVLGVMALVPAVLEELAFRGFVLAGYARLGPRLAWLGTGLLFAAMHGSLVRLPGLAVLGLVFSYVGLRTGSVVPAMWMHFANNAVALTLAIAGGTAYETRPAGGEPLPWLPAVWAAAVALALLPLLVGTLRSLPAAPETAPGDPDRPPARWWPLLPAGLILAMLFWNDLARAWPGP